MMEVVRGKGGGESLSEWTRFCTKNNIILLQEVIQRHNSRVKGRKKNRNTWADMPTSLPRLFRTGWKLWECSGRCRGCASNSGTGIDCVFLENVQHSDL